MTMLDKISNDARTYTDVQSLGRLRGEYKNNPEGVTKEIAQQFEAMLVQMMMRSMRDATKAMSSDLLNNDQMDFYQDIFDKQLSMVMSNSKDGFTDALEKSLLPHGTTNPAITTPMTTEPLHFNAANYQTSHLPHDHAEEITEEPAAPTPISTTHSPEAFVKKMWPLAKSAANMIGADPRILVAQAALETNWGRNIVPHDKDSSSHNLFNIKAGSDWAQKTTAQYTLEQKDGVLIKEKTTFRSYHSFAESFKDYVSFLKSNNRYAEALNNATNPQAFIQALQKAGYATDTNYADKILKIFSSGTFKKIVSSEK